MGEEMKGAPGKDFGRSANSSKKSVTYEQPYTKVFDCTLKALNDIQFKVDSAAKRKRRIEGLTPVSLEAKGEELHIGFSKTDGGTKVSIVSEFVEEADRKGLEDRRNMWNVHAVHKVISLRLAGEDTHGFEPVLAMRLASSVAIGTLLVMMGAVLVNERDVMMLPAAALIMTAAAYWIQRRELRRGTYAAMAGTVATLLAGMLLPFGIGAIVLALSFVAMASAWKAWLSYEWLERL